MRQVSSTLDALPRPKKPQIWTLVGLTYGLVVAVTIFAVASYYFVWHGTNASEPGQADKNGSIEVGSLWVPLYPGALLLDHTSSNEGDVIRSMYKLKTKDPADSLLSFYQVKLKGGRFWWNTTTASDQSKTVVALARGRNATRIFVAVSSTPDGAEASITTIEKRQAK